MCYEVFLASKFFILQHDEFMTYIFVCLFITVLEVRGQLSEMGPFLPPSVLWLKLKSLGL